MSNENTRLLFTSLHPSVTTSCLRTHLLQCPPQPPVLTDLKVVTRKDGTSRCIAFSGFKTRSDAERVLEWSRGTWVSGSGGGGGGGSRIKVDWAKDTKDPELPRASKRIKLDSSSSKFDKKPGGGGGGDSRFQDFLAVMAPPKPSTLHDTSIATPASSSGGGGGGGGGELKTLEQESTRPTTSSTSTPATITETGSGKGGGGGGGETTEEEGFASFPNDDAAGDETLTDAEYLAKRMKRTIAHVEQDDDGEEERQGGEDDRDGGNQIEFTQDEEETGKGTNKDGGVETGSAEEEETTTPDLTIQSILETSRLFLRNLAFSATTEDLENLFSGYGQIQQVHLPVDKSSGASKGLAYITFQSPQSAVEAYQALDGRQFQGRLLHILPAVGRLAKPDRSGGGDKGSTVKQERMELRKQTGGKAFSWATLYLNSNAALSAVADRLGVAKSALLDPSSSSDPAIKVALAEAHTLGEIKQYFENEGVNVEAFGKPGPRSSTCILLKNLPYGSTPASLSNLLAPFGTTNRLLVPPSGTIAIVEMEDSKSAAEAWRGLLYKNFGGSVLYLEKAPSSIWSSTTTTSSSTLPLTSTSSVPAVTSTNPVDDTTTTTTGGGGGGGGEATSGATLFIKNLNFITTSSRLESTFGHLPGYSFSRVQTKPDPNTPGRTLSMGYGFIGFKTVKEAQGAKDVIASQVLDGHQLEVKFAQRGTTTTTTTSSSSRGDKEVTKKKGGADETTTKMLVKNVPFEATRKELRQLFSAYGQLKSVRLPRKMDNTTRGFAFLDFATRRDAESAFSALEHTHLLGRHLVLQWAGSEGDDLEGGGGGDAKKKKREEQLAQLDRARKNLSHKKSKFTMDTEE